MKKNKTKLQIALNAFSYVWQVTSVLHVRYYLYAIIIMGTQIMSLGQSFLVGKGIDIAIGSSKVMSLNSIILLILATSVLLCLSHITEAVFHIEKIAFDVEGHLQ